jgi:nitroreductase
MKFLELAKQRCSIRSYTQKAVSDDVLNEILEAGRLAPTAKNLQPFRFVVVRESAQIKALAKGYPAPWFADAPVVIAVCSEANSAWRRERHDDRSYCDVDAAIAADHMTLAAADLGLGTCWIGAFDPTIIRATLKTPSHVEPLILLTLGYPNETGRTKVRKQLNELVCYETWNSNE